METGEAASGGPLRVGEYKNEKKTLWTKLYFYRSKLSNKREYFPKGTFNTKMHLAMEVQNSVQNETINTLCFVQY
jgi:hypothetical protein